MSVDIAENLKGLCRFTYELNMAEALPEILNVLVSECASLMNAPSCVVRLLDEKRQTLLWGAACGLSANYAKKGPILLKDSAIDREVVNGKVIQVFNVSHDSRVQYPEQMQGESIASALIVPLSFQNKNRGVLRVYTSEPHEFDKHEVELAKTIAIQGGSAIEKALLNEEMRTIIEISRQINSTLEIDEVLLKIVKSATDVLGFKAASIRLIDDSGQKLELKAAHGLSEHYLNKGPIMLGKSTIDRKAMQGQPVIAGDPIDSKYREFVDDLVDEGIKTTLTLPLSIHKNVIGVLRVYASTQYRFSKNEIDFLSMLANQSATAIENARLFAHLRRDYEDLTKDIWSWYEWGEHAPKL